MPAGQERRIAGEQESRRTGEQERRRGGEGESRSYRNLQVAGAATSHAVLHPAGAKAKQEEAGQEASRSACEVERRRAGQQESRPAGAKALEEAGSRMGLSQEEAAGQERSQQDRCESQAGGGSRTRAQASRTGAQIARQASKTWRSQMRRRLPEASHVQCEKACPGPE